MRDAADTNAMFNRDTSRPAFKVNENDVVNRFFPKEVRLTLPDHTQRRWTAGFHRVPKELADHPWLVSNGVVEMENTGPLPPMMRSAPPGSQAHAAAVMQSGVYDVSLIRDAVATSADARAAEAMARMAAENVRSAHENLENAERVSLSANEALASVRARVSSQQSEKAFSGGDDDAKTSGDDELKTDGPTVEEYVKSGYQAKNYPPDGYTSRSTDEEIQAAVAAQDRAARADKLKPKERKEYDALNTDEERDAFLTSKGV